MEYYIKYYISYFNKYFDEDSSRYPRQNESIYYDSTDPLESVAYILLNFSQRME